MSSTAGNGSSGEFSGAARPPRLPRWTRQEILVLIEGKRAIEGRGRARPAAGPTTPPSAAVEPKWAAVSAHCRTRGVDRGPVQCRKRWSNLAGDYKKIKEWEERKDVEGNESFWAMRNDARRERKLPGFFDREVFDVMDGTAVIPATPAVESAGVKEEDVEEEEEPVFDSERTAAEDALFSDKETEEEEAEAVTVAIAATEHEPVVEVTPISEKKFEEFRIEFSHSGMPKDKQPAENPTETMPSQGQKRRRASPEESREESLEQRLIEVLERNSRVLTAQLETQNLNNQLEREQRKTQTESLLGVLSKVADALGRIADKL